MALETIKYGLNDLKEYDLEKAPSLDIPHFETEAVYVPRDGGKYMLFCVRVSKDYRPEEGCPYCKSIDLNLEGRSSRPRLIHDVIRNNMRVDIAFFSPRMRCKNCNEVFTARVDGISQGRQMTTRLEEFLRTECFLQPFTQLAERSGFSITTIEVIMDEETEKYEAMRKAEPLEAPRVLGIDEKHLGRKMRGTLVDIENGDLLDMVKDNKQETMIDAIKKLEGWDKNIEVVTTDMSNAYISWIETLLPNATIVIDKFHVIQDIQQSITKCRKALIDNRKNKIDEIEDIEERARQAAVLRIAIDNARLFNFSMARLTRTENEKKLQQLATVIDEFPEFKMLHNLHYTIEHMYEQEDRASAEKIWREWLEFLPPGGKKQYKEWCDLYCFDQECFEAFRSFHRAGFQRFAPYILNYFNSVDTRVTNAATEGLNSLIGDFNIEGKGYSFERLRAKCLYASLIHERKSYSVETETVKELFASQSFTTKDFMSSGSRFDYTNPSSLYSAGETKKRLKFTTKRSRVAVPAINLFKDNRRFIEMIIANHKAGDTEVENSDVVLVYEDGSISSEFDRYNLAAFLERKGL